MLFALRRAALVVGVTPGVTRMLVESGLPPEKAIAVPNGISSDLLNIAQKTDEDSAQQRPVVAYVGLFGYNYVGLFGYNYSIAVLLDIIGIISMIVRVAKSYERSQRY